MAIALVQLQHACAAEMFAYDARMLPRSAGHCKGHEQEPNLNKSEIDGQIFEAHKIDKRSF